MISYQQGKTYLSQLVGKYTESQCKNEAETRFHFIDEFLMNCLGWDRSDIQ